MTAIEAQAFGKGVICYGKGGVLETVNNGTTVIYFNTQTSEDLNAALDKFESSDLKSENCFDNAKKFSRKNFKSRLLDLIDLAH